MTSDAGLSSWLRKAAVPLTGVDPVTGPDSELSSFVDQLGGVRVIGIGEATHGSSEFFRLKHRLIAAIVHDLGCRTIAWEVSAVACRRLDDYASGRSADDPAEALRGLGYWTWSTREILEFVVWLRAHNLERPAHDRVRIVGLDPVVEDVMIETVPDRVAALGGDAEAAKRCRAALQVIAARQDEALGSGRLVGELVAGRFLPPTAAQRRRREELEAAREELRVAGLLARTTDDGQLSEDLAIADRVAEIGSTDTLGAASSSARDRLMARTISDLAADRRGPIVVWAHNGHVADQPFARRQPNLGALLRQRWGRHYYALGLLFGQGCFQALAAANGGYSEPQEFCYSSARPGTIEQKLLAAYPGDFLVDLRSALDPSVRRWMARGGRTRSIGSVVGWWWLLQRTTTPLRLQRAFDGLAVLRTTTRAVPIPER